MIQLFFLWFLFRICFFFAARECSVFQVYEGVLADELFGGDVGSTKLSGGTDYFFLMS